MQDYVEVVSTPSEEDCAAIATETYSKMAILEIKAITDQIMRQFSPVPDGIVFRMKANYHDFGNYYSLKIIFNDDDKEAADYAFHVDEHFPTHWDEQAKEYLKESGYTLAKEG